MTVPHIRTITIDFHDDARQNISFRMVDLDNTALHLAMDVCAFTSLPADADGDYCQTLDRFGVKYRLSEVSASGEIIGPVALITPEAVQLLNKAVNASLAIEPKAV